MSIVRAIENEREDIAFILWIVGFPSCCFGASLKRLYLLVLPTAPLLTYLVLQDGGVGVDGLLSARQAQVKGVVHVGVAGGKLSNLQPTETENREERERKKFQSLIRGVQQLHHHSNFSNYIIPKCINHPEASSFKSFLPMKVTTLLP